MGFFKKLFGKKETPVERAFTQDDHDKDYELKLKGLENMLGPMHSLVGHAVIPFAVGGAVDMYYFPNHLKGTGFATMELLDPDGNGPLENRIGTYELVAFTKYDYDTNEETQTPFSLIERTACGFLTAIARFSSQAVLNPKETIEVPRGEGQENLCLVFDLYEPEGTKFKIGERNHHLLLCMQVFKNEMDYARENGSDKLFELLKDQGVYPYSDLDRASVL